MLASEPDCCSVPSDEFVVLLTSNTLPLGSFVVVVDDTFPVTPSVCDSVLVEFPDCRFNVDDCDDELPSGLYVSLLEVGLPLASVPDVVTTVVVCPPVVVDCIVVWLAPPGAVYCVVLVVVPSADVVFVTVSVSPVDVSFEVFDAEVFPLPSFSVELPCSMPLESLPLVSELIAPVDGFQVVVVWEFDMVASVASSNTHVFVVNVSLVKLPSHSDEVEVSVVVPLPFDVPVTMGPSPSLA